MKFVILSCLIAVASASHLLAPAVHAPVVHAPLLSTGHSTQSRSQDAAGNYAFAYDEQHSTGGSSRSESGAPGVKTGSYTLNVADGRKRVVNYVADGLGFRASIATNEPGTAALPAAATSISSPFAAPVPVAPLVAPVAVAHHAPLLAAPLPVAHHAPVLAAPVAHPVFAHHAPLAHHAVPLASSYSSVINHGLAAPLHHAGLLAPALHY